MSNIRKNSKIPNSFKFADVLNVSAIDSKNIKMILADLFAVKEMK